MTNITDLKTKKAWELNWRDVSMTQVLEIFEYERVKKQMEIFLNVLPKGEKILEGGCGLAPYVIRLKSLGYDVEGLDYNEEPIKRALAYESTLSLKVGDVSNLPYDSDLFGGYLSLGVIEHFVEGPEKAIHEARRVLKSGGVFVVSVPRNHIFMRLKAPLYFLKSRKVLRKIFGRPDDHHYWEKHFGKEELKGILERGGFEVRHIYPLDHSHAWVSFSSLFRDKTKYDEANRLGIALGRFCEKWLPWLTAAQMMFICYKR